MPPNKLWATVFSGNSQLPADEESAEAWAGVGMAPEKIIRLSGEHNFWVSGPTGPCGSCTEVYYDRGEEFDCGKKCAPGCECDRFLEIWNAGVFIEFNRSEGGNLDPLPFKSVDTGAGLERLALILQNADSVYETTLFKPIIERMEELSAMKYNSDEKTTHAMRIIADHIKASVFIIADGVVPGNCEQGYVLRRLIRRAIRYGKNLEMENNFTKQLGEIIINIYDDYSHLQKNKKIILQELDREETRFREKITSGLKYFNKVTKNKKITGESAFLLYQSY